MAELLAGLVDQVGGARVLGAQPEREFSGEQPDPLRVRAHGQRQERHPSEIRVDNQNSFVVASSVYTNSKRQFYKASANDQDQLPDRLRGDIFLN